ncbi:hypothetical protein JYU34_007492 [Plutella xylostella]|uniref:Uncharacterized protein n=1 Tax=Plutella xylostella TaxID=51655 RepID=A0ABQ7QQI0_PLUXY|nr:hypothetical protein JYU34_007492 [Plutella xylostella]
MPQHGAVSMLAGAWRALAAEVVGTALLVALGCSSLLAAPPVPLTHPALAFGGAVTLLATVLAPISGAHLNPAVSLAAVLSGNLAPVKAVLYVIAQCVGAFLGTVMLHGAAGGAAAAACTAPAVGAAAAAAVEATLTGSLCLLLCGLWAAHDEGKPDHSGPLKVGLAIAGLVYSGGALTGASLNPARSLGPALLYSCWGSHWVYWVGPLLGAALAAGLHRAVSPPAPRAAAPAPEALPLNDKLEP